MDWNSGITPFNLGKIRIGDGSFTLICGPCVAESEDLCFEVADSALKYASAHGWNYVFKTSFDKANRSSESSNRGPGLEIGLRTLEKVKERFGVPVTTDVHSPEQCDLAAGVVDLLQIPAFLCRQTDLLHAAAETGVPVNVKKGQFLAPEDCGNIVQKLQSAKANGILLTERGATFGYHGLIVDMPGLETMRSFGVPVCFDATHSAQRPGALGKSTGGARETIPAMTRAACSVGLDALFVESHPDPDRAWSDSTTQWPLNRLEALLKEAAKFVEVQRAASIER